jgi:DNA-binding NtrC family response regulator
MCQQILLVDDEPTLLRALDRSLNDEFHIKTAESGMAALQQLQDYGPFAVMVTDMKMPQMNGIELVQTVKEQWPDTICIMLTGNQDEGTAKRVAESSNIFRLLNKPVPRSELIEAINAAISGYRHSTSLHPSSVGA